MHARQRNLSGSMARTEFNPIDYFLQIAGENVLCTENKFKPVRCSGPENIPALLDDYRKTANFIVVDDTTDNVVFGTRPGYQTRTVISVWILAHYDFNDNQERQDKLQLCRRIFKQFLSRMLVDFRNEELTNGVIFLDSDNITYKELGRYSLNGVTGLYFTANIDKPTDLTYDETEWQ